MDAKYSFKIFWSPEDEAYVVTVPEFPGLSAFGDTPEEALAEASQALEGFLETYREEGWPLPAPRTLPEYSGQLRLRMPSWLHRALAERAEAEGVSLNTYIVSLLSSALERDLLSEQLARLERLIQERCGEAVSESRWAVSESRWDVSDAVQDFFEVDNLQGNGQTRNAFS